jgi:hypothetical protein
METWNPGHLLTAIGTIAVAILAIWGDKIKLAFGLGPKMTLNLIDPEGEMINISTSTDGSTTPARYYHLKVANKNRWSQATNVRVVITGMYRLAADGKYVNQPLIGPLQLMWRFSAIHPALYSTVGPEDICDLGYLKKGDRFILTPNFFPNNFPGGLEANQKMLIQVKALSDNAESKPICIEISWDGNWSDDTEKMKEHLVVTEIKCQ